MRYIFGKVQSSDLIFSIYKLKNYSQRAHTRRGNQGTKPTAKIYKKHMVQNETRQGLYRSLVIKFDTIWIQH